MQGLGRAISAPNFIEFGTKKVVCTCINKSGAINEKKYTKNPRQEVVFLELLLSNLACKVWYMEALKYVDFCGNRPHNFEL